MNQLSLRLCLFSMIAFFTQVSLGFIGQKSSHVSTVVNHNGEYLLHGSASVIDTHILDASKVQPGRLDSHLCYLTTSDHNLGGRSVGQYVSLLDGKDGEKATVVARVYSKDFAILSAKDSFCNGRKKITFKQCKLDEKTPLLSEYSYQGATSVVDAQKTNIAFETLSRFRPHIENGFTVVTAAPMGGSGGVIRKKKSSTACGVISSTVGAESTMGKQTPILAISGAEWDENIKNYFYGKDHTKSSSQWEYNYSTESIEFKSLNLRVEAPLKTVILAAGGGGHGTNGYVMPIKVHFYKGSPLVKRHKHLENQTRYVVGAKYLDKGTMQTKYFFSPSELVSFFERVDVDQVVTLITQQLGHLTDEVVRPTQPQDALVYLLKQFKDQVAGATETETEVRKAIRICSSTSTISDDCKRFIEGKMMGGPGSWAVIASQIDSRDNQTLQTRYGGSVSLNNASGIVLSILDEIDELVTAN